MTKREMPTEIEKLPIEERLHLVEAIWDGVTATGDVPRLGESQLREIRRRLAAHDADPTTDIDSDTIDRMLATLRKTP